MIEELFWHDNWLSEGKEPHLNDTSAKWGPDFFFDTVDGKQVRNYFVAEASRFARYALPFLWNINQLCNTRKAVRATKEVVKKVEK